MGKVFLNIPTIPGSSTVTGHENEIEIESFQYGVAHPYYNGESAGPREHSDINCSKMSDKASALLMLHCINGVILPEIMFHFFREDRSSGALASGQDNEFCTITLKNVAVSSWNASSSGSGSSLSETFSLTFQEIQLDIEGKSASDNFRTMTGANVGT